MTYSSEVLADSPVVYYRMGEASGTTMTDSSGNGRNGTYNGSPTLAATGLLTGDADTCVDFDGTNDYGIYSPPNTAMNSTSVTAEAWIRPDSVTGDRDIVGRRVSGSSSQEMWQFRILSGGKLDFFFVVNTFYRTSQQSTTSLVAGNTYHVAATFDGSTVRFYINGVLDNTVSAAGPINNTTAPVRVSYSAFSGTPEWFDGKIDEVAIYPSALSGTRIAAHYAAGAGANATVSAVPATATAAVVAPAVSADATVAAVPATATAAVLAPAVTGTGDATVIAVPASATAAALPPTLSADASVAAVVAASTVAALAPTVSAGATVATVPATATAGVLAPTVTNGTGDATVVAVPATATAAVLAPTWTQVYEIATDTSNGLGGISLGGSATGTITRPVAAPPATVTLATKVDKAMAYEAPTMIDGRPT